MGERPHTEALSLVRAGPVALYVCVMRLCVCVCVMCAWLRCVRAGASSALYCTECAPRPPNLVCEVATPIPRGQPKRSASRARPAPCWTQTHLISYIRHRPRGVDPPTKLEFRRRALQPSLRDHLTSLLIARIHRHASPIVTSLIISLRAYKNHTRMSPPLTPRSELSRRANTAPPSLVCAVPSGPDPVLGVKNVRWLPGERPWC